MKKLLLLLLVTFNVSAFAQTTVSNGDFENWNSGTYHIPQNFIESSDPQTFFQYNTPFNVTQTMDAYHGSSAVQLVTNTNGYDTVGAYFINANSSNGNPSTWTGGVPYNQQATGIRGYYKYNQASGDSGLIIVVFKQGGSSIGTYFLNIGGLHTAYTLFDFTFSPALPAVPDTVIFACASSNLLLTSGLPGSTLLLDSLSFTGVSSQPAMLDGDFENWQSTTLRLPVSWYDQSGQGVGLTRSTDAHSGTYSLELQTFIANYNNMTVAAGGSVSTGYYSQACSCTLGGSPFSNQDDTLSFYYKYAPTVPGDSAVVDLNFKQGGVYVWGAEWYLHSASGYQYIEFPFSLPLTPDTVVITLTSTAYQDTALANIGSDLKVDDMQFKTTNGPTGIFKNTGSSSVNVYPNPFRSFSNIEVDPALPLQNMKLFIYDTSGKLIKLMNMDRHSITLYKNEWPAGVYYYEVRNETKVLKAGKIVAE